MCCFSYFSTIMQILSSLRIKLMMKFTWNPPRDLFLSKFSYSNNKKKLSVENMFPFPEFNRLNCFVVYCFVCQWKWQMEYYDVRNGIHSHTVKTSRDCDREYAMKGWRFRWREQHTTLTLYLTHWQLKLYCTGTWLTVLYTAPNKWYECKSNKNISKMTKSNKLESVYTYFWIDKLTLNLYINRITT